MHRRRALPRMIPLPAVFRSPRPDSLPMSAGQPPVTWPLSPVPFASAALYSTSSSRFLPDRTPCRADLGRPDKSGRSVVMAKNVWWDEPGPSRTQSSSDRPLRRGGSAVDAAIGGRRVAPRPSCRPIPRRRRRPVSRSSGTRSRRSSNGRSRRGRSAVPGDARRVQEARFDEIPLYVPLSWSVPG